MMNKEEAKQKVKELIEFYNKKRSDFENKSEQDIRIMLIDRLFKILGWDMDGTERPDEVHREMSVTGRESKKKKADYVFRLNGVPKFVVEAKALKANIQADLFREQAVGYAYNLACSWAVLTNFSSIYIYFIDRDDDFKFFSIDEISDEGKFDANFETLWYLSRESVANDLLERDNEKRLGKRREKVGKRLFDDLSEWRRKLSNEIRRVYGEKYGELEREEIVQRIIDRLIFIRKIEDMELEERELDQLTRKFNEGTTYRLLKKVFEHYRNKYNSGLFGEPGIRQECDMIDVRDPVIEDVIKGMYRPTGRTIEYNFAAIDADVLGNIYEQYLAFIMKGTKLKGGKAHKKEQGIYYTSTYIVDYIVKNTVTESAKGKTIDEILNMKILDPACGSGSFLIRAYSEVCKIIEEKMKKGEKSVKYITMKNYSRRLTLPQKITILTSCIYGVDLDEKAVEIAQLNLLLKLLDGETSESLSNMSETRKLLPMLNNNIKCGNSLIDDPEIAGENKAFSWKERFKEIMDNGGFDVVIGNPPYLMLQPQNTPEELLKYIKNKFNVAQYKIDDFHLFLERGIYLLKQSCRLGFITPNTYLMNTYTTRLRKCILDNCMINKIVVIPQVVFSDASVDTSIIILQKEKNESVRRENKIDIFEVNNFIESPHKLLDIKQEIFFTTPNNLFTIRSYTNNTLIDKLKSNSTLLGNLCRVSFGLQTKDRKTYVKNLQPNKKWKPCIDGGDITRYSLKFNSQYFLHDLKIRAGGCWDENTHNVDEKVVIRQIGQFPIATLDTNKFYSLNTIYNLTSLKNGLSYRYLLALINSKLLRFYWKVNFSDSKLLFPKVKKVFLDQLPIRLVHESQQQPLIKLVEKMLSLN